MRFTRAFSTLAALALLAMPSTALAHAALTATTPAADENLDQPPTEVRLTFGGELQPDGSGFTVTDADGNEVGTGSLDLDVAERNQIAGAIEISEPGTYTVSWTSVAADGHRESGSFTFGYRADAGADAAPDTAMRPDATPGPMTVIGALLLVAAVGIAGRRPTGARAR
jgi:methionine-rich copper-binding protein CopC